MLEKKNIIRYILTIGLLSLLSGFILYIIYRNVFSTPLDRLTLGGSLAYAFGLLFVTYNAYLIYRNVIPVEAKYNLFKNAIFCFLFEVILWAAVLTLIAGLEARSIFINLLTVGIHSMGVPYLHNFLGNKIGVKQ